MSRSRFVLFSLASMCLAVSGCSDDAASDVGEPSTGETASETAVESASESMGESMSGDGDPGDGEPGDGEPGDGEPGDGEPGDGDPGDGEPGDGDPGDGDGDPGDGDPGDGDGDGDGDLDLPAWILSIDETDPTTDRLIQISIDPNDLGTVTEICADITLPNTLPDTSNITSLTFNDNIIYASAEDDVIGDTLLTINPCTCDATEVGKYGYSRVNGITSNDAQIMFGIAVTEDVIIDIDPTDASSVLLQDLMLDWGSTGLTWSQPQDDVLYGINATTDRLHTFDGATAMEIGSIQMNGNFSSVGIELHPTFNRLFACGIAGDQRSLYEVDVMSGDVSLLAVDVWEATCDNIAAPFGPVQCIPQ